jgi:uncharacterized cupredoxin-like copper-binding protein
MYGEGLRRLVALACCSVVLFGVACSDEASPSNDSQTGDGHSHGHDFGVTGKNFNFALGKPGDAGAASRTISIRTEKGFRYTPASVEVAAGETVTFEVRNTDKIDHELVLGNKAYQELHESQVKAGGVYHDYSPYSVHVTPGDSTTFTWTFEKPGRVMFACHIEGHYDEGMFGSIAVS